MFETVRDPNLPPIVQLELPVRDGSSVSVHELRQRFFQSDFGIHMFDQPLRFSQRYGYERRQMRADLGGDVCPVGHQYELAYHLQQLLDEEEASGSILQLTDEEKATLALACSIHDFGECEHPVLEGAGLITVGDIPAGGKTEIDRANETDVRKFFYELFYYDVDPMIIERVEAIIAHKDKSLLHELFEAAHELQTLDTVHQAERALAADEIEEARLFALLGMVTVVKPDHRKKLKRFSHFVSVQKVLAA